MRTAAIYCRVSDARQVENFSLGTQEKTCREYAERIGSEVVAVFVDGGESAKTADRTQFQRGITFCREKQVDDFIVYSLSRFARDSYDHAITAAALKRHGTILRSATEPIGENAAGRLMEDILASFAAFDNRAKSERTTAGMRAAVSAGRWAWQPPLGYAEGMAHDADRAPLVRRAFELAASGDYTGPELRARLGDLGLRGRHGNLVARQTLYAILRNPIYAGIVRSKKWGIETDGNFAPIVDRELFYRAQHALDGKATAGRFAERLRQNPDFPLRGFASCETHGKGLSGAWAKSKTGRPYGYYRCLAASGCVNTRKEKLEGDFEEALAGFSMPAPVLRLFREIALDAWRREHADAELRREARSKQVEAIRARKKRLDQKFVDDEISAETYREQLRRIESETDFGVAGLLEAEVDERTISADLAFAEGLLADLRRAWLGFDLEQKQRFARIVFPAGIVVAREGMRPPVPAAPFAGSCKTDGGPNGTRTRVAALKEPCPDL